MATAQDILDEAFGAEAQSVLDEAFGSVNAPPASVRSVAVDADQDESPGVPLVRGVSVATPAQRVTMARLSDPVKQLEYLETQFPAGTIRQSSDGNWIIRTSDQSGRPIDTLFDEEGFGPGDIGDAIGRYTPALIGLVAGARGKGVMKPAAGAAVAEAVSGGAGDIAAQSATSDIEFSNIAKERGIDAAMNFAFGSAIGGALVGLAHTIRGTKNLFTGAMPPIAAVDEAVKAGERIAAKTGKQMILTPSESSGVVALGQIAEQLRRQPLFSNLFRNFDIMKRSLEHDFQRFMVGGPTPTVSKVADDVGAFYGELGEAGARQIKAAQDAFRSVSQYEQSAVFQGANIGADRHLFGDLLIRSAKSEKGEFDAVASKLYNYVRSFPEASDDIFPIKPIAKAADEIRESLPSVPIKEQTASDVLGDVELGFVDDAADLDKEVITEKGRALIYELLDKEVYSRIGSLAARGGDKTRWFDLVQMRNIVQDAIERRSDVLGDIGTRNLSKLRDSITDAIQQGADNASGEFKIALETANSHYRTINRFDDADILKMLRDQSESGSMDPEQVANYVFSGGRGSESRWSKLEGFFGKDSPQVKDMANYVRSQVLGDVAEHATKQINPSKLLNAIEGMDPGIRKRVFNEDQLRVATTAARADIVFGGKLSLDEVEHLMDAASRSPEALRRVQDAIKSNNDQFKNSIVKLAKTGEVVDADPTRLVNVVLQPNAVPNSEVTRIINNLAVNNPEGLSRVRRLYMRNLFDDVSVVEKVAEENIRRAAGEQGWRVSPSKISKLFEDPDRVQHMTTVLGRDSVDLLRDYSKFLSVTKEAGQDFGSSLATASAVGALIRLKENVGEAGVKLLWSFALSSPKVATAMNTARKTLSGPAAERFYQNMLRVAVSSPEFAQAATDDFLSSVVPNERNQQVKEMLEAGAQIRSALGTAPLRLSVE